MISRRVTFSLYAYTRPPLSSEDVERVPRGRPAKVERGLLLGLRHALASILRGQPEPIAAVLVEVKPVVQPKRLWAEFGAVPILIVNYLKSYDGMGSVKLKLNQREVVLSGLWEKNMSTTATFVSQAYTNLQQGSAEDDNNWGIIGFGVEPGSIHNLTLTFQPLSAGNQVSQKFKLIDVITC